MELANEIKIKVIEYFDDRFYKIQLPDWEKPEYFPSVTTKLGIIDKPFLARWRGENGNRECDLRIKEAKEKGSNVHDAWFVLNTGGTVLFQDKRHPVFTEEEVNKEYEEAVGHLKVIHEQDEQVMLYRLSKWVEIVNPTFLLSEMIVYSLTHKEAGTLDNLIEVKEGTYQVNGKTPIKLKSGKYVLDLKTGNAVYDEGYMQIAAYIKMLEEMGVCQPNEIVGSMILHPNSNTKTGIQGLSTYVREREEIEKDYEDYRSASIIWQRKNKDKQPDVYEFPAKLKLIMNQTKEN